MKNKIYQEFLKDLRKLRGQFFVSENGGIRAKAQYESSGYCPVAGVNVLRGGYNSAYAAHRVHPDLPSKIISAADNNRMTKIRKDLLTALGLKQRGK